MPNKMLIDATHPEETRVVVLRGHRVEEFDFESANRKQLRGNIYLAKVTRVEPSLQAAFVDYGGNRHGFLAFSEIHPDYYQIPVADRQALIAEDERAQRAADAEADHRAGRRHGRRERGSHRPRDEIKSEPIDTELETGAMAAGSEHMAPQADSAEGPAPDLADLGSPVEAAAEPMQPGHPEDAPPMAVGVLRRPDRPRPVGIEQRGRTGSDRPARARQSSTNDEGHRDEDNSGKSDANEHHPDESHRDASYGTEAADVAATAEPGEAGTGNNITEVNGHGADGEEEVVESVGGADAMEEVPERMPRLRRQYKIQEVIKRRQVMLVQVVKEERGTKGAALTTYLSLAGRYSVLMPNTARGGGISRKITSADDRRKLKEIAQELEVPEGMGVILRTAGAARTKTEVKRDFEYLLRLWETVRDLTLKSTAPTLVYEEGSLVKRSIRDLYNKEIDEILVAGDDAYTEAKDFMRMLMPSHAKNVKGYRDTLPIFTRHGIESQLDAMFTPVMQLRSGGYIVLNQAEALVAIDVNSGRATREHHIEDTALKTNLEAAEEIARQLRLRDLAGLIVIDFIDMDEKRNNRAVERRLKECLRHDRARIQVGHISHFGLLEMSRQRIRSSVLENSTEKCPHCGGTGHVRSVSSVALQLLRSLDEMLLKGATHNLAVRTRTEIALYLLNHKRAHLRSLEERFRIAIMVNADATMGGQLSFVIEKGEQVHSPEQAKALAAQSTSIAPIEEEEDEEDYEDEEEALEAQKGSDSQGSDSQGSDSEFQDDEAGEAAASDEARPEGEQDQGRKRRRRGAAAAEKAAAEKAARRFGRIATAWHRRATTTPTSPPHRANMTKADLKKSKRPVSGRPAPRRPARQMARASAGADGADGAADGAIAATARARAPLPNTAARSSRSSRTRSPTSTARRPKYRSCTCPSPRTTCAHTLTTGPREEPPRSVAAPAIPEALAAEPPPEPPRRRSTVREPAPTALAGEGSGVAPSFTPPAPAAEPVVSSTAESESDDRPRRSGWWSKRALGKG